MLCTWALARVVRDPSPLPGRKPVLGPIPRISAQMFRMMVSVWATISLESRLTTFHLGLCAYAHSMSRDTGEEWPGSEDGEERDGTMT